MVTSRPLDVPGIERVASVDEALAQVKGGDAWFIGGARIYEDRFLSLAPGDYKIRVEAPGFSAAESNVHLEYNQTLNVPMEVKVGAATEAITVTDQAPLLNTSETRNQQTLQTQELNTLPLAGRSMISLVTLAPGVSGLGTQTSNAPGSGVDNYSTETAVDISANGQGTVSNMWIVDGLDATSAIRQGVVNLTPNPDFVQEATTEVNTFNVEYGRASSIQFAMTTKSGADQFHGLASDYFNYQSMYAKYSLPGSDHKYSPFHSNNFSANIGGPIIPHHQFFFFFGVEPLRSSAATGNQSDHLPGSGVCGFRFGELPQHVRHEDPQYLYAERRDRQRHVQDRSRYFPDHLWNCGNQRPAMRHADD